MDQEAISMEEKISREIQIETDRETAFYKNNTYYDNHKPVRKRKTIPRIDILREIEKEQGSWVDELTEEQKAMKEKIDREVRIEMDRETAY